jgi:hypothetical protein
MAITFCRTAKARPGPISRALAPHRRRICQFCAFKRDLRLCRAKGVRSLPRTSSPQLPQESAYLSTRPHFDGIDSPRSYPTLQPASPVLWRIRLRCCHSEITAEAVQRRTHQSAYGILGRLSLKVIECLSRPWRSTRSAPRFSSPVHIISGQRATYIEGGLWISARFGGEFRHENSSVSMNLRFHWN